MNQSAFGNPRFTVDDQIAEGDKVATRYTITGTHLGDYKGITPTGKKITSTGITIHRIASGKILEGWANWDALGLLQQLGVTSE